MWNDDKIGFFFCLLYKCGVASFTSFRGRIETQMLQDPDNVFRGKDRKFSH